MKWVTLLLLCLDVRREKAIRDQRLNPKIRESISHCVRLCFCAGICSSIEDKAAGSTAYTIHHFDLMNPSWKCLRHLFEMSFEDRTLLPEMIEGVDLWAEATGIDAVCCLLKLSLSQYPFDYIFDAPGIKLLASDACMPKMITPVDHSEAEWEAHLQQQSAMREADVLIFAGVHPDLSRFLETSSDEKVILAWALLLMNMESGTETRRQHISSVLRNLPSLVQRVLDGIVEFLPLIYAFQKRQETSQLEEKTAMEMEVMHRETFTLQEVIQSVGVPQNEAEWCVLAMKMYHVMLVALPVCVRLWFNDMRSKHRTEAIKQYTALCESPQLIQHEFSKIATLKQESAMDIRTNVAGCEVVAKLHVEDQTSVELVISIPDCVPLKPLTVECPSKVRSL